MQARFFILILVLLSIGFYNPRISNATKVDEIKTKIEERTATMTKLEEEIAQYQKEIEKVGEEKQTLNNEVYRLNLDKKKLTSDISLTNDKIYTTSLTVEKLDIDVKDKESKIEQNTVAISETIRLINESDSNSLVEMLLSADNISDFLSSTEDLQKFQTSVREKTNDLINLKSNLEIDKNQTEEKKRELVNYYSELEDKKIIVDSTKKEKDQLLTVTKNKESNYKQILEEKQKLMAEFQKEVSDLESQLKIEIDPNSFPAPESGVLSWPLDNIRITQFFGNTLFASQNAQVYNGNGHNGVDFGVSSGTKVKAVLGGVVKGTGNTDTIPPKCYSYGKWVLIEHNNGLSTLYAHLSLIKVEPGQFVNEGDIIGYSGNTGYSTGPHLHFGVYATAGVQIQQFTNSINCKDKFIPIASLNAYLNPMDYLPKL
ncbi:peptidoglycan DD-metalloendopeptidase family protein [Patescibacteria group bacterium]|nr:peptidoglycan DD-metalloendopeptidase family protein [Patescibacteria group bacterium]